MTSTVSMNILVAYTLPLGYLLSLYILYTALHCLLLLSGEEYFLFFLLHYGPALVYAVHRIAADFSLRNILFSTVALVVFPVHFILTLYYKILFSLKMFKMSAAPPDETAALLSKVRPDSPFHTFLITFTCVQIPMEAFLQMALYLRHFRHAAGTTALTVSHLTLCLLLSVYGAVSYFRHDTQNKKQYLFSRATLKRIGTTAYRPPAPAPTGGKKMSQFQVESSGEKITDAHSFLFQLVVSCLWLLHNYIRLVSIGLLIFFFSPAFALLFLTSEAILFFLIMIFYQMRSGEGLSIGYAILQGLVLNFCLIEYKLKLNRKWIVIAYFAAMFTENLLFTYLWYGAGNPRRHKTLFTWTVWSLAVSQILHFFLLFVYLFFYKPKTYEIDYYADTEDEGHETLSENEEFRAVDETDDEHTHTRYENVGKQSNERPKKPLGGSNVDRIRTPAQEESQKNSLSTTGQKVAFDNLVYAESAKVAADGKTKPPLPAKPPTLHTGGSAKYKQLISELEEHTVYSRPPHADNTQADRKEQRKSLTAPYGVPSEQRDSWKYIVEEIDNQIHKSTSSLHRSKLHLSSDRLSRKNNRSTDSLDRNASLTLPATQLVASTHTADQNVEKNSEKSILETSHTKSHSHVMRGRPQSDQESQPYGTSLDPVEMDTQEEEEIVVENRSVVEDNAGRDRMTRYSSQEFLETRRVDERVVERKREVKKLNTTSLV